MAISSINFQKAKAHSYEHNFRKDEPNYLLPEEHRKENEFWQHPKSEREIFDDEFAKAKRRGGRIPQFENSRWEAVLNLNSYHDLDDVKEVAEHIEKKFTVTCSEISIHRDEGFIDDNGKPQYNYHAHLNFITYKDGRQNWRKEHIRPVNLARMQSKVAKLLKMERGTPFSKAVRLEHKQHRAVAKDKATIKQLKALVAEQRKALQEAKATRADYAQLEQAHKELKQKIARKEMKTEVLSEELAEIFPQYKNLSDINKVRTFHEEREKKLIEARETILKQEAVIDTLKALLERGRALNGSIMSDYIKFLKDNTGKVTNEPEMTHIGM